MGITKISNCRHDENGKLKGGAAGDQTTGEYTVVNWYSRPWKCVLRYPDKRVGSEIARIAKAAAENNAIGYDQGERRTYFNALQAAGWEPGNIKTPCEEDCSASTLANIIAAGHKLSIAALQSISPDGYTGNMRKALQAAGFQLLTDSKYLTSSAYLLPGDVLLNDGHHTTINLTQGDKTLTTTNSAAGSANEKTIWDFLKNKGFSDYATAGIMGNLNAESGLNPINLQNSYEKKFGTTDAEYTQDVDNGNYTNFAKDAAGYGLAQWTYWTRKQNLLSAAKAAGKSIGDITVQLNYLVKELSGYAGVMKDLQAAGSVLEASNAFLTGFEKPANQGETVKQQRAGYGETYYKKYAAPGRDKSDATPNYQIGKTYTLQSNLYVRQTPNGLKKNYSELSADGQKHAYKDGAGKGILKSGTVITCKETAPVGSAVWIKTPSGYICGYSATGTVYVK